MTSRTAESASPRKKRSFLGRLIKWLFIILILLGLAIFFVGPMLIGSIGKQELEKALAQNLNGAATVKELKWSWPGQLTIRGIDVRDERGNRVLGAPELTAEVGLLDAIRGKYRAAVTLEAPEITLKQGVDGTWNVATLAKAAKAATPAPKASDPTSGGSSPPSAGEPIKLPTVFASLRIKDGRLTLINKDGVETKFDRVDLNSTVDLPSAPVTLVGRVAGDRVGEIAVDASLQINRGDYLDLEGLSGKLGYKLERIDLEALAPLVRASAPVTTLAGRINGAGTYDLRGGSNINGSGGIRIEGLRVDGPAVGGKPLALSLLELKDELVIDPQGTGTQKITLTADRALKGTVQGKTTKMASEAGNFEANFDVEADLNELAKVAPGFVPLKPGVTLQGIAKLTGQGSGAKVADGLGAAVMDLLVKLDRLAVTDASGRPLPIDPVMDLTAKAKREASGLVQLDQFDLRMGKVVASGAGSFDPANKAVGKSHLTADADLDDLARKLGSFMDLPFSFGGQVKIASALESAGDSAAAANTTVKVTGLRLQNIGGKNLGPLDLDLKQKGVVSWAPGGQSTIEQFELDSPLAKISASGSIKDATDAAKMAGDFQVTGGVDLARVQATLGDFLAGYELAGTRLSWQADVSVAPDRFAAKGNLDAPDLLVRGPSFGPAGARLTGGAVKYDLDMDTKSGLLDLRTMEIATTAATVNLPEKTQPVSLRDVVIRAVAKKTKTDLDISDFSIQSNVARGSGKLNARGLGEPGMALDGQFDFQGDAGSLLEVARGFVPGLETARASGGWNLKLLAKNQGKTTQITEDLRLTGFSLDGMKAGDKVLSVQNADIALAAKADLDGAGAGALDLRETKLTAPGVDVSVQGRSVGFLGEGNTLQNAYRLSGTVQPGELSRRLSAFLVGYAADGQPLTFNADVDQRGEVLTAKGNARTADLRITLPPDPAAPAGTPAATYRTVNQKDLDFSFDITQNQTKGSERTDIRDAKFQSRTARAEVRGSLAGTEQASADLSGSANLELADLVRDLGAAIGLSGYDLGGRTQATFAMKGSGGALVVQTNTAIDQFRMVAPGKDGAAPVTITEPRITLDVDTDYASATQSVVVKKANVQSGFLRGGLGGKILNLKTAPEFQSLVGDFTYNPDRLGAVIRPWFTGKMAGAQDQQIKFTLDGKASETDWISVLRGSRGDASFGLTSISVGGFTLGGDLKANVKDEKVTSDSTLGLNNGVLALKSNLDLRRTQDAVSTVNLSLAKGSANSELGPILELLSPIFAVAGGEAGSLIQGLLDVNLDLSYKGMLDQAELAKGWDALPKQRIDGKGRVAINNLALQGGMLGGQILNTIGLDSGALGAIALDPIEFTITRGRLAYDKPLAMMLGGVATRWTGSIGLDKTLDMAWEIPITDKMVQKNSFLQFFRDTPLRLPVGGTTSSPIIKVEDVFADLAKQALQKQLTGAVGNNLPGGIGNAIGDLLGGNKPPTAPGGTNPQGNPGGTKPPAGGNNPLGGILEGVLGGNKPPAPQPVPPPAPAGNNPAGNPPPGTNPPPRPTPTTPPPSDPLGGLLGGILGGNKPPAPAPGQPQGQPTTGQPQGQPTTGQPVPPAPKPPTPQGQPTPNQPATPQPFPIPIPGLPQPQGQPQPIPPTQPSPQGQPQPNPPAQPTPAPAGTPAQREAQAAGLLNQADALYGERQKAEAAAIYQQLRSQFNTTVTYLTNRAKIDQRSLER